MPFVDPDEVKSAASQKSGGGFVDPSEASTTKVLPIGTPLSKRLEGFQQEQAQNVSAAGAFTAAAFEAAGATPGALVAARTAMAVPQPVWAKPISGVVGGVVGGYLSHLGITSIEDVVDKVFGTKIVETRKKQQQQYPGYSLAGAVAGGSANPFMRPGLPATIGQAAFGSGIMVGVGAGQRAVLGSGEDTFDPKLIAIDAAAGAFTKPTKLGERVLGVTPTSSAAKSTKEFVEPSEPVLFKDPEILVSKDKVAFVDKLKKEKAKVDATVPIVKAAIKNKETGVVTELGAKHPEDLKKATVDTHDQGFVDANGMFLDRKEAWNRAKTAGQISERQVPDSLTEGLRSSDLRKAGDENFKVVEIPTEVDGIPITEGSTKKTRADGRPIGATTRRNEDGSPKEVVIDTGVLYDQFAEKPWTKPKVEGVFPIADDAFKTPQEWIDFVIQHEIEHTKTPAYEGQSKASYENQINKAALEALAEKKASDKAAGVIDAPITSTRPVETSPSADTTIDRSNTSPRDVANEQQMFEIASEIYAKHGEVEAVKFYEGFREYQKTWAEPVTEVENFVGINLNSKPANERIVHNNTANLKESAGKDVDLNKLTYDIDKGVPLEGKAKDVADKFRTLMDDLGKRALENGVIKGWHENYVARNVVSEGNAPKGAVEEFMRDVFGYGENASGGGTKTTTKYGQERRLETREDLVNHIDGINGWLAEKGLDYRFKLKTDNLADIYKDYALSVEKAIENKNLVTSIKQIRNVEGESLIKPITPEQPLPYNWKQIDHPDLAGFAIHPDLIAPLKFVFDSGPGMTMQALGTVSQAVKRVNVIGSFFHAKSLMEVLSSAKIPLWTPLKDAIVLPLVEKGVKAVTGKDLQLSAITKAVDQFNKGGLGDNVDTWIRRDGLMLETPEDASRGMLGSIGKFADTMIGKYGPKTRVLESSMSTVEKYTLGIFDKYTWDYLHTGGKLMVADAYLEKARLQAAKEGKPFDEVTSRKEIAAFINDSFGGLNWFDAARRTESEFAKRMAMAAYSPEGRRALQVVLFAPDWTTSTIRAFTAALPKSLNPTKLQPVEGIKGMINPTTKADYARLYQLKTALLYLTLLNAINNMTADRDIWDNKDPTRLEWPDGTSMQAMKHAMEPYHWIAAPDKTLANKLGFIPKAAIILGAGTEYASPNAPKLVDKSITGRLEAVAKSALPFQVQAAIGAPEGEEFERALLGTAGFPVYGSTPEQRKQKKKERDEQEKANAAEYHRKAKEKGWEK